MLDVIDLSGGVLIPNVAVLLQSFVDDAFEFGTDHPPLSCAFAVRIADKCAFALQQLQRIGRALRALLFHQGQHFVLCALRPRAIA
jgi:hypothetical protein